MNQEKIAKAYAKSLIELSEDKKIDVADELVKLNEVINENNDLETLLFLDVFTVDEKKAVLKDVLEKINISGLLSAFINYLLEERRIGLFPLIFKEIIVIDDHKKGFLRGTIEGSGEELSNEAKEKLASYIAKESGVKAELEYKQNEKITAGYRVTVGDLQLDATVDNQLSKFKETILN